MTERVKQASEQMWNLLFRVVAVTILPWSVWATASIFKFQSFINRGDRFSASDGHHLEKTIIEESRKLQAQIVQYEKEFSSEFVRHSELKGLLDVRESQKQRNKQAPNYE